MNKKGFTLIELLAVIVILAIIALIATPIVLSIINDSKQSATIRSAEFYANAVQNKIMQENMKQGGTLNPEECIIDSDGNVTCDGTFLEIEVNGEKPTSGSIKFDKGKVTDVSISFGDKTVTMNSKGELVLGDNVNVCKLINDADNSNSVTLGDKYQCKVKDEMEEGFEEGYYFYVLSQESDGTTNLIMDRNINSNGTPVAKAIPESDKDSNGGIYNLVAYNIDGHATDVGPVTAMEYLNNATSTWENIDNLNITYDDEGENFTNFKVTGKARLPYKSEVNDVGCLDHEDLSCPVWMGEYLHDAGSDYETIYQENPIDKIYGYWTFSSYDPMWAWYVVYDGGVYEDTDVNDDTYVGVRPVINVNL